MSEEKVQLFECSFRFRGLIKIAHHEMLTELMNGFWVNKKLEFTKMSDNAFFIMPHMITEIEKIYVDKPAKTKVK